MEKTSLSATGLCKFFGQSRILDNISLELASGSFECVMGPSGSGKSTLLHILAGLLSADAGSVSIGGKSLDGLSDSELSRFRRKHVGLVFQDFNLVPTLTAEENVALPLLLSGESPDEAKLSELLDRLAIAHRRKALPGELSGGERQRVAIARAFLSEPDILLADEPTGNLDSPAARSFCEILRNMNEELGRTILLVTHDPIVAAYADRLRILKDGTFVDEFETHRDPAAVSFRYLQRMEQA